MLLTLVSQFARLNNISYSALQVLLCCLYIHACSPILFFYLQFTHMSCLRSQELYKTSVRMTQVYRRLSWQEHIHLTINPMMLFCSKPRLLMMQRDRYCMLQDACVMCSICLHFCNQHVCVLL